MSWGSCSLLEQAAVVWFLETDVWGVKCSLVLQVPLSCEVLSENIAYVSQNHMCYSSQVK